MFSKVLAQELAEHGIHFNVVSPGLIDVGRRGDVNSSPPIVRPASIRWRP